MKSMRLEGKICAITGGGAGIGRAAAERFGAEGAIVCILEVNPETGTDVEKTVRDAGGEARFLQTDVSRPGDVATACGRIEEEFGRLDVLYNNASVFLGGSDGPVHGLSLEAWERILAINLNGLFYACKFAIPLMLENGGSIINTSSSAGVIGIPNCDAYTATKGAAISLTRSLAVEYGPHAIRVNCIAPAAIATDMVIESNFKDPDFNEGAFLQSTPVRRWGEPADIANLALFLASDESAYLNGAIIVADGGITIT